MYFYLEDKESKKIIEYSYYRKFNALHGYFVKHFDIENCRRVLITKGIIKNLYALLNEVKYSPEKADQLLPTYPAPSLGHMNMVKSIITI